MLTDNIRIIDVLGWVEFEEGIVVDVIVEPLRAHTETGYNFAPVERLFCTGDRPAIDKVDNPVAEHFGVDAEVFFVFQESCQCLGDPPDPALNCAAVLHEPAYVLTDAA